MFRVEPVVASLTDVAELVIKSSEARDLLLQSQDMPIQQRVHIAAIGFGRVAELEERSDLAERHAERAAITDEDEPLLILR